jgi:hypothetical protein
MFVGLCQDKKVLAAAFESSWRSKGLRVDALPEGSAMLEFVSLSAMPLLPPCLPVRRSGRSADLFLTETDKHGILYQVSGLSNLSIRSEGQAVAVVVAPLKRFPVNRSGRR